MLYDGAIQRLMKRLWMNIFSIVLDVEATKFIKRKMQERQSVRIIGAETPLKSILTSIRLRTGCTTRLKTRRGPCISQIGWSRKVSIII